MSEVKKLKIGDTSYDVRDATTLQNLTSSQEAQIETDGTYNGNVVEDGTVFTTEEGKFKALTITNNYSAGTASSVASSYSSKCSCNGDENKGVAVLYEQNGTHIIVDDGTEQTVKEVSFAVTYLWYTNGHYFALDNSASKMYVSTNLDDWEELTSVSVASRNGAFSVVYHNGSYFFAYQNSSRNVIVKKVSDDFETASDVKSTYNYYAEFPELASDGTTLALFYGGGANSSFDKTTDDGATWASSSLDTSRNIRGHVNLGGYIYILDLNNSKVLRTTDFSSFDVFDIANYSGSSQGFSIIKSFGDSLAVFGYYYGTFLYCSDLSTMTFSGAQALASQQGTALDVNEKGFVGGGYTVTGYYRVPITVTHNYYLTNMTAQVDQEYSPLSTNAMSGVAVADALDTLQLTDIASAGTNITFTTPTIDDYSIAGTDVSVTSGIASGFTQSSYVYKGVSVWNSAVNGGSFVLQIKFKINSYASNDFSNSVIRIPSSNADNGTPSFSANVTSIGRLKFWSSDYEVPAYTIATGVDYWLREVYNGGSTVSLQISTDGTNFTQIHTASFAPSTSTATNMILGMGKTNNTTQLLGSIDLTQTYIKDGNGNVIWAASAPAGVPQINATAPTVDQTYNSSSANAQSGVAIAGAGFLSNASTGTDSLCVSTITNTLTGFTGFGVASQGANYAVSIGLSAKVGYGAVSLGMEAQSGAGSNYAVCLGWKAKVAASCPYAIQLGTGTNSTANTLSVGLSNSLNVELLDSSGNIPAARLGTLPSSDGTYIPVLTITSGVPSISWVAYTP